jgi:NADH-quinone oxidoreductase subunit G
MDKLVTLTIDGRSVQVPAGTLIVDAAKMAGITIPVFCYHPKLEPVGMCRMCLVDIGRPAIDRATGQPVMNEDGTPKISFGPKLETACTTPVSEGMVIWGATEKVLAARNEMIEFLLTSHPLDCPICDKGGECPLQDQTLAFGPGKSRYIYDEKHHARKDLPLGDLILLDRERCIQCARCIRFQDEVVDDPAIGFFQRGRDLEIVSYSEPGFDSIFSGNTTDICPVGALTTSDFRFAARPWEMTQEASICTQCPVGCNLVYEVRREAKSGGKIVIKRTLPRQNEAVNEIWLCDKGRFAYHFSESSERLTTPLVRRNGELTPASWDEALQVAADKIRTAGENLVTLAGGRLLNEDLFALKMLSQAQKASSFLYSRMGGGKWVTRVGMTPGSDLRSLGKGSAILVFASDLHQEAPIWWLRVKQAAERGAVLIVASARKNRLDKFASFKLRYNYGSEEAVLRDLLAGTSDAARAFVSSENSVFFLGSDGLGVAQTAAAAEMAAELLMKSGHFGKPNNGLIPVWQTANEQAAWEMGMEVPPALEQTLSDAMGLYIAGADPAADGSALRDAVQRAGFVIVQDLFLTETARLADVVFPVQAPAEREGSLVSGERRVQRLYSAVPALEGTKPDFMISAEIAARLGVQIETSLPEKAFAALAETVPQFAGLNYARLAEVDAQWPPVGGKDMYFAGTGNKNTQGVGIVLELDRAATSVSENAFPSAIPLAAGEMLAVPVTSLYNHGLQMKASDLLKNRTPGAAFVLNPEDSSALHVPSGGNLSLQMGTHTYTGKAEISEHVPQGVVLVRREMGVPLVDPSAVRLAVTERESDLDR